ncbi:17752_t:CDS:2, partial [Cetraspora pellucida]
EARDTYKAEILKDGLNLLPNYYEDGNFPSVPWHAHNILVSFIKNGRNMSSKQLYEYYAINNEFPKWINDLFRGELHALFIQCRNLDDSKSNAVIKKFLKILVPEIDDQNFDDAASRFHSIFIECRHVLWTRINKLFEDLQRRAKSNEINKIFAAMTARNVQKVWQQFLVNINISAICEKSTITNNFEKLLSDVVHAGLWTINFFQPKDAQAIFFNLNNNLYTVNLNVLTPSGWNVASSIDLSCYNFTVQKGPEAIK